MFLNSSAREKDEDARYISDIYAGVLYRSSFHSHLILWLTALFTLVALAWANFAMLDEITRGSGKIIPSTRLQVIQNLEGGILAEILIREGDIVEKGQPLMRLDDVRFAATFGEERIKQFELQAQIARLNALVNKTPLLIPETIETNYPELARQAQRLYESKKEEYQSTLETIQQQVSQREQELVEAESKISRLTDSYAMLAKELELSEPLVDFGALSEVELLRLKRTANDLQGELRATQLSVPRLRAALKEAKSRINEHQTQFRTALIQELNDAKVGFDRIAESMRATEDKVSRTLIRAPVKGTVKQIKINTIGGVVQPGMDLIEIVPFEDQLLIQAEIRPSDIAFLHPGQKAIIKLTAYDFAIYGGLEATLDHISADTITNPEDGKNYYLIRLTAKQTYFERHGDLLDIIPGMTADVEILTGKKSVLDYLLKPILRAKATAMRER
ncbi:MULTISPECIES: HlyD family type I secretion periplasmic adaptor subunit [Methylotuvimicrobium]|uniref:Membrane fusion protein (MFP) family protein n=2 Tax=Methylotuvimicrobium TaxID=2822410 RepID=G4SXI6_META2|nr:MULTISPECIES: HlyD family type I secretion periplasmic adaptor subunit [Methylotuvimicrobium]QCW84284.1 HlyD family type I secretion periplasmic adaptor subunit [Methylotuvimicrobium buryatense]CCE25350.1 Type I secretion membrane fusion protein, HlyD family [Methylotuvimicrobium alcaliphilum 20Z]